MLRRTSVFFFFNIAVNPAHFKKLPVNNYFYTCCVPGCLALGRDQLEVWPCERRAGTEEASIAGGQAVTTAVGRSIRIMHVPCFNFLRRSNKWFEKNRRDDQNQQCTPMLVADAAVLRRLLKWYRT